MTRIRFTAINDLQTLAVGGADLVKTVNIKTLIDRAEEQTGFRFRYERKPDVSQVFIVERIA